jgi:hypothetical protein
MKVSSFFAKDLHDETATRAVCVLARNKSGTKVPSPDREGKKSKEAELAVRRFDFLGMLEQCENLAGSQLIDLCFVHTKGYETTALFEATAISRCAAFAWPCHIRLLGLSAFAHDISSDELKVPSD